MQRIKGKRSWPVCLIKTTIKCYTTTAKKYRDEFFIRYGGPCASCLSPARRSTHLVIMTPPPPRRLKALASKKSLAARQNNSAFLSGKLGRPVSGEDIYAGPIPMPLSQLRDVYPTITENVKWSDGFLEHELCEEESPEVLDSNPSESHPPPPPKLLPDHTMPIFSKM